MEDEYVALYKEGRKKPCGVLKASYAQLAVKDLEEAMGCKYWTEPVSVDEAKRIREEVTAISLSEELENIFSRAKRN